MDPDTDLLHLEQGLVADDAGTRALSADAATDIHRDLSPDDVAVVALLLGALRLALGTTGAAGAGACARCAASRRGPQ